MKIQLLYLTICSLTQAAYISRMTTVNRRSPTAFRPGVMLQRPWIHQRILPAASHRAPYMVFRGPVPYRYPMKKPYIQNIRSVFSSGPWKTGRLPVAASTEYEFMRAASAPPVLHTHGGAIHTIPAPNLSLSEKPIVVVDASESSLNTEAASEVPKATYEVTEKYTEPPLYQMPAKLVSPIGFAKQSSLTTPELQQFVRNGASFPLSSQYGVPSLSLPQNPIIPQQFSMQGFTELSGHQDLIQTAAEGIIIPPSALYQNDPTFLQKLQNQLLQQFPSVEFIPYTTDVQPQNLHTSPHPELFLLENEVITQQVPFKSKEPLRNIVQRETQEGSVHSLMPQAFATSNLTENLIDANTLNDSQNATLGIVTFQTEAPNTTVKYVETTTEEQKTTPIYYAQVGQSVGNIIAKGFYSAINDVRAAAAQAQVDKTIVPVNAESVLTTIKSGTVLDENLNSERDNNNETSNEDKSAKSELKPPIGAPFEKSTESVNVAYTLLRSQEDSKVNKEGNVYAGQLVQAMISEDRDFNKDKPNISKRPPLRQAASEKKVANIPQKLIAVKAKIPPKSKLIFDDKTGEPVLRIFANYSENPTQKELLLTKLSNLKHYKEAVTRKQDTIDNWKATTKTSASKIPNDANQISQFGLKLRSRSEEVEVPLFEEYEE